jgi:single-strand DNA-binding protein
MASLNTVCLLGHLTRTPEVRYSSNGTPVAALGLAVNSRIKRSDDSWQDDPCFVDVVVFGSQAEACATDLHKGDPVLLEGRLQYRTWEDQQGHKRSKHEVLAFGSDIHVMLALCRRFREVVVADQQLDGTDMISELLGR